MAVSGKLFNVCYNLDQALIKYGYNPAKSCGILRQSSKGLKVQSSRGSVYAENCRILFFTNHNAILKIDCVAHHSQFCLSWK